ncbi:MAG: hypothetical protein AUG91_08370 [Actinobacteria bacterium 13_1_20CM_4_69_9]|nr:MAG: hypothetical protein AUG91_08370 [Actinobacteria bacterium 13_1_20CM_4_69_9]
MQSVRLAWPSPNECPSSCATRWAVTAPLRKTVAACVAPDHGQFCSGWTNTTLSYFDGSYPAALAAAIPSARTCGRLQATGTSNARNQGVTAPVSDTFPYDMLR